MTETGHHTVTSGVSRAWRSAYMRYLVEPYLYVGPALALIGFVILVPLAIGISYSFQAITLLNRHSPSGLPLDFKIA